MIEYEGYRNLCAAVIEQAVKDYRSRGNHAKTYREYNRNKARRFLKSNDLGWYIDIANLDIDPDFIRENVLHD